MANGAEFFKHLAGLREGDAPGIDVVQRARAHCRGGAKIRDLDHLWSWMNGRFPESAFFDFSLAAGAYPTSLAAFVIGCGWRAREKHAVWMLHGELFTARLKAAKNAIADEDVFRDNLAGALMHRANGAMHVCRTSKADGIESISLPSWVGEERQLSDVATAAVKDLRQTCALRSQKYGRPTTSKSTLPAYRAALKNLATALEICAECGGPADAKMAVWLRSRADELVLGKRQDLLEACEAGEALDDADLHLVRRDLRLADNAASLAAAHDSSSPVPEPWCAICNIAEPDMRGFSCRCVCLCRGCAGKSGNRVQECPRCGDYTEFVPAG
jgi:hypothetical protein